MPYGKGLGLQQINPGLSNLSVKYANDRAGYVVNKFPTVNVAHETDTYYVYGREAFQIPETIRANGAEANQSEFILSTQTYSLDRHSLKDIVTDRERANANVGINPDVDTMELLTDQIMNRMEYNAAQTIFTTATSFDNTGSLAASYTWNLLTTGTDVIGDVSSMTAVVMKSCGKEANTMLMGEQTYRYVKNQPNIIDRIKYSERGVITPEILSAVFDIKNIVKGSAVYDAGIEGSATPSTTWIWNLKAAVMYLEPNAKLKSPSALYNFAMAANGEYPYAVKKYRNEAKEGDEIEVNAFHKTILTGKAAGFILNAHG
jgi:hypothetical protein